MYKRSPRCPYCKSVHIRDVNESVKAQRKAEHTCYCPGEPFPHRAGTMPGCLYNEMPVEVDELRDIEARQHQLRGPAPMWTSKPFYDPVYGFARTIKDAEDPPF